MNAAVMMTCAMRATGLFVSAAGPAAIPTGTRGWETVPGVVRNDGVERFNIEVHLPAPVAGVTLNTVSSRLVAPAALPIAFRDDGILPDRVAGDSVYTAGPFTYRPGSPMPVNYMNDSTSPAGLDVMQVGEVSIVEAGGTTSFLIPPMIGILDSAIPVVSIRQRGSDVAAAPHVINVASGDWSIQTWLHGGGLQPTGAVRRVFRALPDVYDLLILLSTNRLESIPASTARNFVAGQEIAVRVNYDGTGKDKADNAAAWGSGGRLLGIVSLDGYDRGLYSGNLAHEILHQWGGSLAAAFDLNDAEGHYNPRSSIGSLLGGQAWIPTAVAGQYVLDCTEGRNGAHQAAPLDRYLMGLAPPDTVGTIGIYATSSPLPLLRCGQAINDVASTVSISQIIQQHGLRSPGPASAQCRFNLGFVAVTRDRLLTPTEMTFYEILATHATRVLPASEPAPYVAFDWVPITRFFGTDTAWASNVLPGDFNQDGGIDAGDIETFARCDTGPGVLYSQLFPTGCTLAPDALGILPADFDGDGDVDAADFAALQRMSR